ncbi:MAG TPA: polysaccharide pyruvyl transferase family protein [Fimbriimonas sp.]
MNFLVEQSGHALTNLGDWAMLQVCVSRIRRHIPDARISVVANESAPLEACLPDTRRFRTNDMGLLLASGYVGSRLGLRLGRAVEGGLLGVPGVAGRLVRLKRSLRPGAWYSAYEEAERAMDQADAVVASGGGFVTDAFPAMVSQVCGAMRRAQAQGKPTAMFGQGLGPLTDPRLVSQAKGGMRNLELLSLREPLASPDVARRIGVRRERALVTGDDATELAFAARPGAMGSAVGFNLRRADYSGMEDDGAMIGEAVQRILRRTGAEPLVIPISLEPSDDWGDSWAALGVPVSTPCPARTPSEAIALASRCRVVVTGSYHAAVFALGQGVPAIGLVKSAYYAGKFEGLAALYPEGCRWTDLSQPGAETSIAESAVDLYRRAPDLREGLLEISFDIVRRSQDAHFRFLRNIQGGPGRGRGAGR